MERMFFDLITDLTRGKPSSLLWRFSLPMLGSVVFQQLYNIADSVIAGQFVGEDALAAVGASYPITMIFMAVAMGCNIGCSVVISQLFGAKQLDEMKTAVNTSFLSVVVLSLALTLVGFITCDPLLGLLRTPANIFLDGSLYLKIYIGGLAFLFLYNICTGIFTALGDSRTPLLFLIASSIGNIALDLVFVICFHMGVAGVAWATFLAQGAASVLALAALLLRLKKIETQGRSMWFSPVMLKRISLVAVPSILQQSFISVGNLFIQGMVNGYGSSVVAGYSAAVKLNTFAITSFTTLANGVSSYSAQNIGAGKFRRVRAGFRTGVVMAAVVALPFLILYFFFSPQMVRLFMDNASSEAAVATGKEFLQIVSPFYLIIAVKLMADAVLRGGGAMGYFMIATFSDLVLRVVLAAVLSPAIGPGGIWISWPIGWIVAAVLSCVFYFKNVWLLRGLAKDKNVEEEEFH